MNLSCVFISNLFLTFEGAQGGNVVTTRRISIRDMDKIIIICVFIFLKIII